MFVERAVIRRQQVLGEGQLDGHPLQLAPELLAYALAILSQTVGRLISHAVFRWHRLILAAATRGDVREMGA
jgi:hypothetical protein